MPSARSQANAAVRAVCALGIMAALLVGSRAALSDSAILIRVEADRAVGPLPHVLSIGTWPFTPVPPRYVADRLVGDFRPGTVQIDLGEKVLAPAMDAAGVMMRLAVLDTFLRRLARHGDTIFISFSKMPPFLAADRSTRTALAGDATTIAQASPPQDYAAWGTLVARIVSHIRELGIHAFYNIGWEPDTRLWQGSSEQFFALYRAAALAVRKADPEARVGGPGVSDFGAQWRDAATGPPMIREFLAYASRTPLPELELSRLPLDFVSFHLFGADPQTSYAVRVAALRGWLNEYGFAPKIPIFVGEWSDRPDPTSRFREHSFIASAVVANLIAMARAGIDFAAYTSLTEEQTSATTNFNGGFGLFTRDFVERPSYRAFQALDELGRTQIPLTSGAEHVYAVAGKDRDRVAVVAANFIPQPEAFLRAFAAGLSQRGYPLATLAKYFKNAEELEAVMRQQKSPRDFGLPEGMARDMTQVAAELHGRAEVLKKAAAAPTTLHFDFHGLSWLGPFEAEVYKIDQTHQNAARLKSEIDARLGALRREKSLELRRDFAAVLSGAGFTAADIELAREFAAAHDRGGFIESRPAAQRGRLIAMVLTLEGQEDEAVAAAADRFNRDPRMAFTPVSRRPVAASDNFALDVQADPASVAAVVLKRR